MLSKNSLIFVAGHNGLVGSAIVRKLKLKGYKKILTVNKSKLNLKNQSKVLAFFKKHKPQFVFISAAKVGGIYSNNKYKAEFIYDNIIIQSNIINSAYECGTKNCRQPIKEKYLLTGELEKTNEPYAIAKIAGIKMCESYNFQYKVNYKCLMPTNTYGPNDNYHELNSHFFPSLIRKAHEIKKKKKKQLTLWGNGNAKREMIYVDDLADACVYFMNKKTKETLINIGTGKDYSIKQYAKIILGVINPNQKIKIKFDKSKPNGTSQKKLDISLTKKYSWKPKTSLIEGIKTTYANFLRKKQP